MNHLTKYSFLLLLLIFGIISCTQNNKYRDLTKDPKSHTSNDARQVHLDFHTSEHIDSIGFYFDKEQFQKALIEGNVNYINVFAKGHHSWSYYPTKVGTVHPNLSFDLLKAQIEACKEIGVKVNAYFTVGWSANDVLAHPEWAVLDKNGTNPYREMKKTLKDGDTFQGWEYMAPEGPYANYILTQVEELVKQYDIDGVWFDILKVANLNYNEWSIQDMKSRNIDINDEEAVTERNIEKYLEFFKKSHELIKKYRPEADVFYNGTTSTYDGNIKLFKNKIYAYNTKHDLEDLPTAWGGYDIFPWRAKYFANTGKPIVAMSGKFHKAWGEFGGFKHPDAILYEAASMIAFGAAVNFGDQLHPSGIMDMSTYKNIGKAFNYVEKIEQYGVGAKSKSTVGLYLGDDIDAIEGVAEMLLETHINFNVINNLTDWSDIETIIITSAGIEEKDESKIQDFINEGGKVLAIGEGIIKNDKPIINIGAQYIGKAKYDMDYTVVNSLINKGIVSSPYLNYSPALRLEVKDAEVLANIKEPYFSRSIEHYSSHSNTPYALQNAAHPAVIKKDNIIYVVHDIDRQYHNNGMRMHRELFKNCLDILRTNSFVDVEMPSMGRVNLLHQPDLNRYVVHLTYASPVQKGSVKAIEDLVPLYKVPITLNVEEEIKEIYLVPSGLILKPSLTNGKIQVTIPEMKCHTAVVFEY